MAEKLGIPQVTYVRDFSLSGDGITVKRALEDGYELIDLKPPCLLTAIKELNEPRYMSVSGIFSACKKGVKIWNAEDLGLTSDQCGLDASPTNVFRSFTPEQRGKGMKIEEADPTSAASTLIAELKINHII